MTWECGFHWFYVWYNILSCFRMGQFWSFKNRGRPGNESMVLAGEVLGLSRETSRSCMFRTRLESLMMVQEVWDLGQGTSVKTSYMSCAFTLSHVVHGHSCLGLNFPGNTCVWGVGPELGIQVWRWHRRDWIHAFSSATFYSFLLSILIPIIKNETSNPLAIIIL